MVCARHDEETDMGHILIKEEVYGCYGNCAKRTEHAANQLGRQAGRQDIDSPHLNSGQPLTKLPFPHITIPTLCFYRAPCRLRFFFFFHNQPPSHLLSLSSSFPISSRVLVHARKYATDRGLFRYYEYNSFRSLGKPSSLTLFIPLPPFLF